VYSHEQLIEFHVEARAIKEHWWYEHQEPDMYPILTVRWRDMKPQSVDVAGIGNIVQRVRTWAIRDHKDSWVAQAEMGTPLVVFCCLAALDDGVQVPDIEEMPPKGTPIEGLWLATEGYGLEIDDEATAYATKHGDLKHDYETNPESKVLERLTTYQVETSSTGLAEWGRVTSSFHKDDGGKIVWHEPHVDTSEAWTEGEDGYDKLLAIMIPHVTREKLA
jgi:hypothetical protein